MRPAIITPGRTKKATRRPAVRPASTSWPELSSQLEKPTEAIASRPGSSRRGGRFPAEDQRGEQEFHAHGRRCNRQLGDEGCPGQQEQC